MSSSTNKRFGKVLVATSVPFQSSGRGKQTSSQKVVDRDQLVLTEHPSLAPSNVQEDSHLHGSLVHGAGTPETLDIDDIDLDDEDPPMQGITTQKKKLTLLRKFKPNMKGVKKLQKAALNLQRGGTAGKVEEGHDKPQSRSKGQIIAAYGLDQGMTGTLAGLQDRLSDRQDKMKAIEVRTSEMQNAAQTFRTQADELLKAAQAKHKQKLF